MARDTRAASSSAVAGSPQKTKRSPKKAKFSFEFKSCFRFNRSKTAKLPCDGMSPINTHKRSVRAVSDPVLNRVSTFDGEGDVKGSMRGDALPQEIGRLACEHLPQAQDTMIPQPSLDATDCEQADDIFLPEEELTVELTSELHPGGEDSSHFYFESTPCERKNNDEQGDRFATTKASIHRLRQDGQVDNSPSRLDHSNDLPIESLDKHKRRHDSVSHADDQHETRLDERLHTSQIDPIANNHDGYQAYVVSFERRERESEPGLNTTNSLNDVIQSSPHIIHAEEPVGNNDVGDRAYMRHQDDEGIYCSTLDDSLSGAGSVESELSRTTFNLLGSHGIQEDTRKERIEIDLPLSRSDEDKPTDDGQSHDLILSLCSPTRLIASTDRLGEAIPLTTTHRIRVGVLPGSPIHTPTRLMSIFEDDEEKNDDDVDVVMLAPPIDNQLFSSGTTTIWSTDDSQTAQTEHEFMVPSGLGSNEEPDQRGHHSNLAPYFTPTSPVEVVEGSDPVIWLSSGGGEFLDALDDGESTWTNCSSYEGDSGSGPTFGATGVDLYVEAAVPDDSIFSGEELVVDLDQTEERLDDTILVVGRAIELASDVLGIRTSENENVNVYTGTPRTSSRLVITTNNIVSEEHTNSDAGLIEIQNGHEFLVGHTTAQPDEASDIRTAGFAMGCEDYGFYLRPDFLGSSTSSLIDLQDVSFHQGDELPVTVSTLPILCPFADVNDGEDRETSSTMHSTASQTELATCTSTMDYGFAAPPSNSISIERSPSMTYNPSSLGQEYRVNEDRTKLLVITLWVLAILGSVLVGVALFDVQTIQSPHCDQNLIQNSSIRCHEVWNEIAGAKQDRSFLSKSAMPSKIVGTQNLDHGLPDLLESDVIAACELVAGIHTNDPRVGGECESLWFEVEEERFSEELNNRPHGRSDRMPPTGTSQAAHYILGLALTLLVVAFLQYDSSK